MTGTAGYGFLDPSDHGSDADVLQFIIRTFLGRVRTIMPVKVIAVHGGGTGASPPTVDVQPLVNQVDGQNNAVPHGTIFGLQVVRWQAGTAAIVMDPIAGDIGIIACADRDISSVVANKKAANPGSYRRHDLADGIYLGSILGAAPAQFIEFTPTGISIKDTNGNTATSSNTGWALGGNLAVTGNITATGSITAGQGGGDQVTVQQHIHSANNTPPTPGH